MVHFSKLGDACSHLAIGNGMVKPHDVPDAVIHAVWNQNAAKNIAKPTCCWYVTYRQMAEHGLRVLRAAAGGQEALALLLVGLAGADASSLVGGAVEFGLTACYEQSS